MRLETQLFNSNKSRWSTAQSAVSTINTSVGLISDWREKWHAKRTYTATIPEDTFVFLPLLIWVNEHVHTRAVRFNSTSTRLTKLYDSTGRTKVSIDGHTLYVSLKKPTLDSTALMDLSGNNPFAKSLVFTSVDSRGIDALHRFLDEMRESQNKRERQIWVYRPGNYGWDAADFAFRDIDSIFLPGEEKAALLEDISDFMDNEQRYLRMGIPWHRGYLFYGAPGNGKSSLTAAIAHKYKFNLYDMPLSTVKDDKQLTNLIADIERNSILLIEDVDIFSNSMHREQADAGPTLAGLLNALDGVSTPNGLVTILTTNMPDVLDDALVRPGRVDYRLELCAPVDSQITDMFKHVYGEPLGGEPVAFDSMAMLADVFKRHPDDVNLAREEVLNAARPEGLTEPEPSGTV